MLRAGGRPPMPPRGSGFGWGGLLRFALYVGILAALVLIVSLTVLRPVVAQAVVDWAADNPSALRLPFVADLVRENLGARMTGPASSDASQVVFVVQDGDSAASIAARLQEQGFLQDARSFVFIATERNFTTKLEAGTYILRRSMTPDQLVTAVLVSKEQAVTVGIREGLRLEQITAKLETLPLTMDPKAFYEEATHPAAGLLKDYPWLDLPKGASLEGFLAPATYTVLPDIDPEELIRKMLDRFHESVGADRLNVPKSRGMTFYEVLTLASLVEREAFLDEDRPMIGGVYQNRLNPKLWPTGLLQSDPTIFYLHDTLQLAKLPIERWTEYTFWAPPEGGFDPKDVPDALAGYNTYTHSGLMPGPICTPTVASIDAALDPNTGTGYLFFVAKNDGSKAMAYAKTYAQHLANLKKYGYR